MFEFFKSKNNNEKTSEDSKKPAPPRFMARLKTDIGPCVWAVHEEDHFIWVYGEKGKERLLYRFSDAVHDLHDYNGTSVDLDNWVLQEAIDHIEKVDDRVEIVIKSGERFSVSNRYQSVLQENGLLKDN